LLNRIVGAIRALLGSEEIVNIEERRGNLRMTSDLKLHGKSAGQGFDVLLLDVGVAGLRVELTAEIQAGRSITLTEIDSSAQDGLRPSGAEAQTGLSARKLDGPLCCQVRWCRQVSGQKIYHAGLSFEDSDEIKERSWVKPLLDKLGLSRRLRRQKRQYLRLIKSSARLCLQNRRGDFLADASLIDLSRGGARILVPTQFQNDVRLRLSIYPISHLPPLELASIVLDSHKDEPSGQFVHRLLFDLGKSSTQESLDRYLGVAIS
jgi:hypothetical protein